MTSTELARSVLYGREVELVVIDETGEERATQSASLNNVVPGSPPMIKVVFEGVAGPERRVESVEWRDSSGDGGVIVTFDESAARCGGGKSTTYKQPFTLYSGADE